MPELILHIIAHFIVEVNKAHNLYNEKADCPKVSVTFCGKPALL